ncbi:MAG TPA: SDR family oxidoreductase, partial [Acidobacteriota bacterium]|nr:SDR family oxidoreductase [Acidobacteriota bacterium]
GAARGVGAEVVRHLADLDYEILLNYNRSEQSARDLLDEVSSKTTAHLFKADISKPLEVKALFDFCRAQFGQLDVLVNNASYSSTVGWEVSPENLDWNEWQKTIDVDLKGTMLCSHEAYRLMKPQKSGKIINFSSSAALSGDVPTYLYTAAKAAIVGVTRTLARAFAPEVQVNCIAPGSIATDWIEKWKLTTHDLEVIVNGTPLRRIGTPQEVAALVAFLASPECTFMTGQTLVIDGGILLP